MKGKTFLLGVLAVILSFTAPEAGGMDMVSADSIKIHYHRFKGDYDRWSLWVWDADSQAPGNAVAPSGKDDFGVFFEVLPKHFPAKGASEQTGKLPGRMGILPRLGDWEAKDDPDRVWTREMANEVYILSGREGLAASRPDTRPILRGAWLDAPGLVTVSASIPLTGEVLSGAAGPSGPVTISTSGGMTIAPDRILLPTPGIPGTEGVIFCDFGSLDLLPLVETGISVRVEGFSEALLKPRQILDAFRPDPEIPLGMTFENGKFHFRVFSPLAQRAEVLLYDDPGRKGEPLIVPMTCRGECLWEAMAGQTAEGRHYTVRILNNAAGREAREGLDPYATCISPGGKTALVWRDDGGLPMKKPAIEDKNAAPAPGIPENGTATGPIAPRDSSVSEALGPFDISKAVIYELHLRDFTIDAASGVSAKGKYMGLAESGTRLEGHPEVATGLDHLVEMGIDVVQIMPVHDFANDEESDAYNWGYMPVNFNSPDGWYASTTAGTARMTELAEMIRALHSRGIRVVLDVVYNHTAESLGNPINFESTAPGYFYRFWPDGTPANGSGCGNEFRSESPMGRRYIVDTLGQWVTRYGVDGFRFDLMGLIDLATMTEVARTLRKIKPDILIYGEPWAAGPTPSPITGQGDQRGLGIAVFNDKFRDAVRGSVWDASTGFAGSDGKAGPEQIELLRKVVAGSTELFTQIPQESINYVEVHDNRTLRDRFAYTRPGAGEDQIEAMVRISAGLLLTSQGTPLIHSGMEMLRTKGGEHNSYDKPDSVNMIKWNWKVMHRDLVSFFRDLIAMRKSHPMFTMSDPEKISAAISFPSDEGLRVPPGCFAFRISGKPSGDPWTETLVLVNPGQAKALFDTGRSGMSFVVKNGAFVNGWNSGEKGPEEKHAGEKVFVGPLSLSILRI